MSDPPPPPARKHPKEFASTDRSLHFAVNVSLFPASWNESLTAFFSASEARARLYWLLASLARHQAVRTANAMAFDLFLALVPLLGLAGWTASLVVRGDQELSAQLIFSELTPAQVDHFIGEHVHALAALPIAPFAALAGWWLVSSAFNTMIGVFEETFSCEPRHWIKSRLLSLGFALLAMFLVGASLGAGVIATMAPEIILDALRYLGLLQVVVFITAMLSVMSFLALIYRYSLRRPDKHRRVWVGAFVATFLGLLATLGLGYYATNIARYALFYGGLAAIIVVLLWLWLWSSAILIGAEINIALEDVDYVKRMGLPQEAGNVLRLSLPMKPPSGNSPSGSTPSSTPGNASSNES